jgi:uncharacterized protein (TIGR02145 family)
MKSVFWINTIVFTSILLLIACNKEEPPSVKEYPQWPAVKTLEATNIDSTTAKLNGTVNCHSISTTVTFEYGTTTSYGKTVTAIQSPITGDSITHVSAEISDLTPCTIYHFRIIAENSKWINFYGSDSTFISGHIPNLTTSSISEITSTTAVTGGNITNTGGAAINERGIYWWNSNMTGDHFYLKNDSAGTGNFTSKLTGLDSTTTYFVQSSARNCAGIALGNIVSFTTLPPVKTLEATNVSATGGTLNGNVYANNLTTTVTFEYGITTSYGSSVTAPQNPIPGNTIAIASADISDLAPGITYHFRIKATNALGTFYGIDATFTTKYPTSITDVDGNNYNTVTIGTQVWMAENLRTTHYADGTTIPLVTEDDQWRELNSTDKAYCWFNNEGASNAKDYGALYTWAAAMNGAASSSSNPSGIQGVCPEGWHLPSDDEWTTLTDYLGGLDVAASKLKETGTVHWRSPNAIATNESGFTALPGGHRSNDAVWWDFKDLGFWWSSTKQDDYSWYRVIVSTETTAEMYRRSDMNQNGFSVRCVIGDQYKIVMTSAATNISTDGATLNGYILANNLSTIVTFEYGTSTSYGEIVSAIQSPLDGHASTDVSATLTGLTLCDYHFRVKAENSIGISYGDDITFSLVQIPVVKTNSISGITSNSAISGGIIIDDGCASITARGVRWSKSPPPWTCGKPGCNYKVVVDTTGMGSFTSNLTGLSPNTTYHVRAYAINSAGTALGDVISFTTLP